MANDAPLNPYQPPSSSETQEATASLDAAAASASRPWGPWATLGWSLAIIAAFILLQTVVAVVFVVVKMASGARIDPEQFMTDGNLLSSATLATTPVMVALAALLIYFRRCSIADYLGLTWPGTGKALIATAGLVLLVAATDLTTWLLSRPIVPPFMDAAYRTASLPLLLLTLLVAAPVGEETLFRGFMFRGIADSRWRPAWAIGLSSFLWASLHAQYGLFSLGTIFVMGLYLGWVRHRTGSMLLTMLLHSVANAIATVEVVLKSHGVF
jgi:membrane protease YdiL (CAAX protease family)